MIVDQRHQLISRAKCLLNVHQSTFMTDLYSTLEWYTMSALAQVFHLAISGMSVVDQLAEDVKRLFEIFLNE